MNLIHHSRNEVLAPVSKSKFRHHVVATFCLFVSLHSWAVAQAPTGGGDGGSSGDSTSAQSPSNAGGTANQNAPQRPGNVQNPNTAQQPSNVQNSNARLQQGVSPQGTGGVEVVRGDSYVGTVGSLTEFGFMLTTSPDNPGSSFMLSPATVFIDVAGHTIPRESFDSETPVTVYYTQAGSEMIASRVVANEPPPVFSAGTTTEVSPGIIVIELPGSSPTSVRYVDNQTTNYVDQNGTRVNPDMIKLGTPVKVFYTKIGDTFVASKVEVVTKDERGGLPKPPLPDEPNTPTPERR